MEIDRQSEFSWGRSNEWIFVLSTILFSGLIAQFPRIFDLDPEVFEDINGNGVYDSGDYPFALQEVVRLSKYEENRHINHNNLSNKKVGYGIACFVEKTGLGPFEGARIEIDQTGAITVSTGAANVGQGLETTLAQIASSVLSARSHVATSWHPAANAAP
mgnify:CR=1 FL=1